MSKPFQSHGKGTGRGSGGMASQGRRQEVVPAPVPVVTETKSSALKKRTGVVYEKLTTAADGEAEDTHSVSADAEGEGDNESEASSKQQQVLRTGRSGFVDVGYNTLVAPAGLKHRSLAESVSPTTLSFSLTLQQAVLGVGIGDSAGDSGQGQGQGHEDLLDHHVKTDNSLSARLMGLPGNLSLDSCATANYFGATAREKFHTRISYLQRHRDATAMATQDEDIYNLHYDREAAKLPALTPFGVDRSNRLADPNADNGDDNDSSASPSPGSSSFSPSSRPSFYERFKAKVRGQPLAQNDDVMLRLSAFRSGVDDLDPDHVDPLELELEGEGEAEGEAEAEGGFTRNAAAAGHFAGRIVGMAHHDHDRDRGDDAESSLGPGAGGDLGMGLGMGSLVLGGEESLYASQSLQSSISVGSASGVGMGGGYNHKHHKYRPEQNGHKGSWGREQGDDLSTLGEEDSQASDDTLSVLSTLGLRRTRLLDSGFGSKAGRQLAGGESGDVTPASPRSTYINACISQKVNPRASLVIRKGLSKRLELQNYGMGDANAALLATAISSLPFLQSINVANNRLTDEGLYPLLIAVSYVPSLLELDLSQNKVDDKASEALKEYLRRPDCPLERLVLNQADVDDFECAEFIEAVMENRSLLELELSHNLLGGAENLNTVMPELTTGAEALAEMIRSPTIKLQVLKLDWNMLRLDGAVELCESLGLNHTLTDVDLSYNSLGSNGGQALGKSLILNKTLKRLRITNNSLDATACFTICAGVIENRGLELVHIDGNPICEQGAAALMLVPLLAGSRVSISAAKCNVIMRDPSCWFAYNKPMGSYSLNLEDAFERAIMLMLLHAVAAHHSFLFEVMEWSETPKSKPVSIALSQVMVDERVDYFDDKQKRILEKLQNILAGASDIQLAVKLFNDVDEDGSGEVERGEFGDLIKSMGIDMSEMRIDEIFASYDMDQGGSIGITEFLNFLKTQKIEASHRIKDMCFMPIMVETHLAEAANRAAAKSKDANALHTRGLKQYIPPHTGTMRVVVVDGYVTKDIKRVLSNEDRENLESVASQAGGSDSNSLLRLGVEGGKLRLEEGLKLLNSMYKENGDLTRSLFDILPQMASHDDAKRLIFQSVAKDKNAYLKLKRAVGSSLRPIMGAYNGFYRLDLSTVMDRLCFSRLLEISATQKHRREKDAAVVMFGTHILDLSQHRNNLCFRNEHYNRKPITIDEAFASSVLPKGVLEFDFSCDNRPTRDDNPLPDFRVVKMCVNVGLLDPEEALGALHRLMLMRRWSNKALECDGHNMFQPDMGFANAVGECMEDFYSNMQHRNKQVRDTNSAEMALRYDSQGRIIDETEDDTSDRLLLAPRFSPMDPKDPAERLENASKYKVKLQRHMKSALMMRGEPEVVKKGGGKGSKKVASSSFKGQYGGAAGASNNQLSSLVSLGSSEPGADGGDDNSEVSQAPTDTDEEDNGGNDSGNEDAAGGGGGGSVGGGDDRGADGDGEGDGGVGSASSDSDKDESSDEEEGDEVANVRAFMKARIAEQQAALAADLAAKMAKKNDARALAMQKRLASLQSESGHAEGSATAMASGTATGGAGAGAGAGAQTVGEGDVVEGESNGNEAAQNKAMAIEESTESAAQRLAVLLLSDKIHVITKAKRLLETIDEYFSRVWLWARHLSLVMHLFRGLGQKKATRHFGTFRVEAFVILVNRVVDLHNIECVFRVLSPYEVACIYARLGWLSLWNPCKPEGCWELSLTRPEERVVVKCLCELSTKEPGDNWVQQYFKWERKAEGMPGWNLTQPWLTEEGLPTRGIISVEYYSGDCKFLRGCRPLVPFRKSLLALFLVDEDELVEEGFRDRPPAAKEGRPFMLLEGARWGQYLGARQDLTRAR